MRFSYKCCVTFLFGGEFLVCGFLCCSFNIGGFLCRRGYNIGVRLVDEFLAKSNVSRCVDFRETAEVIAKVLLFSFLLIFV